MNRNLQIRLIELIRVIPAQRPVLPPLLHHRMEHTQPKQQFLPLVSPPHTRRLLALQHIKKLPITHRLCRVRHQQTRPERIRRLVRDLHRVLQHRNREALSRVRGQPQAELWRQMAATHAQVIADPLQVREEERGQVAVLQENPGLVGHALLDGFERDGRLALAERHRVDLVVHVVLPGEAVEVLQRVLAL